MLVERPAPPCPAHRPEGRYGTRCNVTYIGAYRLWMWDPRPFPFAAEVCQ